MQQSKKIYLSYLLLSIYLVYFGTISLFVHSHVYNGVVYIHSHPYHKNSSTSELPIEAHHHTSSTFFTLNLVSTILCNSAKIVNTLKVTLPTFRIYYIESVFFKKTDSIITQFNLRAPPSL